MIAGLAEFRKSGHYPFRRSTEPIYFTISIYYMDMDCVILHTAERECRALAIGVLVAGDDYCGSTDQLVVDGFIYTQKKKNK